MIIAGKSGKIFLAFLLFVSAFIANLFSQNLNCNNLTVKNGLSNNKVNAILQDKTGFLWIGTEDGLNRFDGYDFKIFRNNPLDTTSISDNNIWSLFEDTDGNIWIGTKSGELNLYNIHTESFQHWKIKSTIVNENSITAIYRDKKKNIWVGTYQSGLYRLNLETSEIKNWSYNAKDRNSLSNNFITSIVEDVFGNFWLSTYNGLNKFIPTANENYFFRFNHDPDDQSTLNSFLVWSVHQSLFDENRLWIGTANGLASLDIRTNRITRINTPIEKSLQFGNSIADVTEEKINGNTILWLATYGGLIHLNLNTSETFRYIKSETSPFSIISNEINSIIKDRSGVIWCATENGLSYISPKALKFNNPFGTEFNSKLFEELKGKDIEIVLNHPDGSVFFGSNHGVHRLPGQSHRAGFINYNETSNLNVWTLENGNSDDLWIGTFGQGLKQLSLKSGQIKNWKIESPTFKTTAFEYIKSLYLEVNNILWIGFWGGGFAKLDTKTGVYKIWISDSKNPESLSHNDVWDIHRDRKGRMWLATNGGGLNLFIPDDGGKFLRLIEVKDQSKKFSSNSLFTICESSNNFYPGDDRTILWIGSSNGLNKISINNHGSISSLSELDWEVEIFNSANGLADNSVNSIVEDSNGNLWLGTNIGISSFNVKTESFINYTRSDGLVGDEMNSASAVLSADGIMYFGSVEGLNIFNPENINLSGYNPPVVISDFQIFNQPVKIAEDSPLTETILVAKSINLSYSQNVFSFQFSALDFNDPQSIQYAYKMEGFDDDWINSDNRRFITYTNLDPGTYNLRVKATNSDGVWSENEKTILVSIGAPWWRTGWAYVMYVVIIIVGVFTIRKIEINRAKLRNELKMREFEAKKQRELENIKSRFFANLSHEFRTPLTLIRGPVEELIKGNAGDNKDEYYDLIKRNSEKLQELIDQLLELTQLENAAIPLKAKKENIVKVLRGLFYSFESLAKQKNISINFSTVEDSILCWFDRDKLEKIINNLLSNAFKFTSTGGTISLSIIQQTRNGEEFVVIKISDTGIGIPKEKLGNIFNRFYQVDDSSRKKYGGSGIGLALVKELVDLHKWQINVESELEKGTQFSLRIPLWDSYLDENNKIFDEISKSQSFEESEMVINDESDDFEKEIELEIIENKKLLGDKQTLLVVEDSEDVRSYLKSLLKNEYNIHEAINGEDGLIKAAEVMPDLIISDVMMPSMNGMEFCNKIKTDWQTSHIPVILLTAKASPESKLEGLETGADDYLTKPFSFKELSIRIKNLLEQRRSLREKFSKEIKVETSTIAVTSLDNEFLQKAFDVLDKNLSNTEFNSVTFAKEMFVSRSQLHRKVLAVTGQAPGEFIRTFRLKKAAAMILEKKLSVTQIAYEVGFNSPSHFTKAFRQQFNCLPTEFTAKA